MDTTAIVTVAEAGLTLLQQILPAISGTEAISAVVKNIVVILPVVAQFAQQLLPKVQDIIATLTSSEDISDDDIVALQAASAVIDAHFDATADAAVKADALAALALHAPAAA